MNYKYIKSMSMVFILTIMLSIPIQVQAIGGENKKIINGSQNFINTNVPKGAKISSIETVQVPKYKSFNDSIYSLTDLENKIRHAMDNREKSFSVNYKGDTSNLKAELGNLINDITNNDDYLNYSYSGYSFNYNGYENDVTIRFSFDYLTTKSQEDFVDSKVSSIIGQIINPSMNDDQKEKNIHDYIVKNVKYDTSLTKFSAYNALSEGKTVCQGYALLAYKMLKEVGIENKIISGTANNGEDTESHAWNLVKLNEKWYHLDCTWDDPVPDVKNRVIYDYYNLPDSKMELNHSWDHCKYPSAVTVYKDFPTDSGENKGINIDFSKYKKWSYSSSNVSKNKVWNIKFTKPFDASTVNSDNILVYKEYNNLLYPVKDISVTYNSNKDTIYVAPLKEYTSGTYRLVITQNVLSKDGKAIPKPIVLTFYK